MNMLRRTIHHLACIGTYYSHCQSWQWGMLASTGTTVSGCSKQGRDGVFHTCSCSWSWGLTHSWSWPVNIPVSLGFGVFHRFNPARESIRTGRSLRALG